ncbi:Imm8 family immunity protein [Roseofilum sp. Guam]|uniref:Imm8 family immunity protein n=1 Tax=Roseofilum sp. Guam TaxID=2821502 RepID=UPI001AFFE2B5|nr:Imm8 family immunity protein [Roseofilum sp. Guam]MBP0030162.1 hypothetical protein [Roseofilum sp. Guam]
MNYDNCVYRKPGVIINLRNAEDIALCQGTRFPLSMTFRELCDFHNALAGTTSHNSFAEREDLIGKMCFAIREEDRKVMDYDLTLGEANIEPGTEFILAFEGEEIKDSDPPQVQLEIKNLFSPEVALLSRWKPAQTDEVYLPMQLTVGAQNREEKVTFYFVVATPKGFQTQLNETWKDYVVIKETAFLIIENYEWNQFYKFVSDIVKSCRRRSWDNCVSLLSAVFRDN